MAAASPAAPAPPPLSPAEHPADELLPSLDDAVLRTGGSLPPVAAPPPLPPAPPAMPPPAYGAPTAAPPMAAAAAAQPASPAMAARAPQTPAAAPAPMAAAPPMASLRPAGYWLRAIANTIDLVWLSLVLVGLSFVFGGPTSPSGLYAMSVAALPLLIVVLVVFWAFVGGTPGKLLLGLRVIGGRRRGGIGIGLALARLCALWVTFATFGLGFLMVAFTRDKRALHDLLANTAVIRR
jgi:uncharacterized RDD family membrane protein YckC